MSAAIITRNLQTAFDQGRRIGREEGYEDGRRAGLVAGRKESADAMRKMMGIIAQDKDKDIARCAALLLEGFNSGLVGKL